MGELLNGLKRTHRCTELCEADIGKTVTVMGWAQPMTVTVLPISASHSSVQRWVRFRPFNSSPICSSYLSPAREATTSASGTMHSSLLIISRILAMPSLSSSSPSTTT